LRYRIASPNTALAQIKNRSGQQRRFGPQQARIVQNGYRFIKAAVVNFKFGKLDESRGNRRRFDFCLS
jgi:hypothetical protein